MFDRQQNWIVNERAARQYGAGLDEMNGVLAADLPEAVAKRTQQCILSSPRVIEHLKDGAMPNGPTILLVEDESSDVLLIQRAFQKAGLQYRLRVVRDGDQAIQYLSGQGQYGNRERFPLPFLVLLDLRMPGTDGLGVLQWARAEPGLKRLLIVVFTSSELQSDIDRAYEAGANSYLIKPVEFEQMVHLIQRFEIYWTEINRTPSIPVPVKTIRSETSPR
jgi:CheY-like chemotaxis protein